MLNNTDINNLIDRLEWDYRYLDFYQKCSSSLDQSADHSCNNRPLIVGYNHISFDRGRVVQQEVNGWPSGPKMKLKFEELLREHQAVNNNEMIGNARDKPGFLRHLIDSWHDGFITDHENISKKIEYKNLSSIPDHVKYLYPIELFGFGHLCTDTVKSTGFHLPDRVVNDAKNNLCKILIHERMEGHAANLKIPCGTCVEGHGLKQVIKATAKFYDIPIGSFGFLDSNYLTPELQKTYGTKGFFYPYWEYHLGRPYEAVERYSLYDTITRRLYLQKTKELECQYRFVCLNRRSRMHRAILTSYIHANHDSKILWSFMPEQHEIPIVVNYFPNNAAGSKLSKETIAYFKILPKNIDISAKINDIHVNQVQFKGYINLVTETFFDKKNTLFFSEKIYKPLYAGQPFILVGNPKSLKLLKQQGYETFSPWINESYDDIVDPAKRMRAILDEVDRLCNMPENQFKDLMSNIADVCLRNHIHFLSRRKNLEYLNSTLDDISDWLYDE